MLDKDTDFDRIILNGLGNLWFREEEYWCPDAVITKLLDTEDFKNYHGFRIMK